MVLQTRVIALTAVISYSTFLFVFCIAQSLVEDDTFISTVVNLSVAVYLVVMVLWGSLSAVRILSLLRSFRRSLDVNASRSLAPSSLSQLSSKHRDGEGERRRGRSGMEDRKVDRDDSVVLPSSSGASTLSDTGERKGRWKGRAFALSSKAVESSAILVRAIRKVAITVSASCTVALCLIILVVLEQLLNIQPDLRPVAYYLFIFAVHIPIEGLTSIVLTYSTHQRPS